MSTVTKSLLAFTALLFVLPAAASAQDERFRVSFAPSVAALGGDAELALSGVVAYRFAEHFWFEGDITWVDAAAGGLHNRSFDFEFPIDNVSVLAETIRRRGGTFGPGRPGLSFLPNLPIVPGYGNRSSATADGSTFIGTVGVRYELPRQTARFRPYLSGGLGINNTDQELRIEPLGIDVSNSHTGYAFNGGAGASVRIAGGLWADVDAKYFRLSGDRDVMRFGGGVSVRF
jgi:opacity protein-like surface antigen